MTPYERKLLFEATRWARPKIVLEVGTGSGASSHFILEALHKNKRGVLHTCDPVRRYKPSNVSKYRNLFHYYHECSSVLIPRMIQENKIPDFLFFDGPEVPEVALDDFKILEGKVSSGTVFMMHDWYPYKRKFDNGISVKSSMLRPYFHSLETWNTILEISGAEYEKGKETVGMIIAQKI